ncbi:hypothetical protein MHTCC0001_35740 [Flavobacteriaceae bacterium MHTCC 0001]
MLCNCKTNEHLVSNNNEKEVYKAIDGLLSYYYNKSNPYKKGSVIIIDSILKFNKKDFKNAILKFQGFKKHTDKIPKCADKIHNEFDFDDIFEHGNTVENRIWDIKKIIPMEAKMESITGLRIGDPYVSLSLPIFNKDFDVALIKANLGSTGEIIYFLIKSDGKWNFKCELFLSHY